MPSAPPPTSVSMRMRVLTVKPSRMSLPPHPAMTAKKNCNNTVEEGHVKFMSITIEACRMN